MFALEALLPGEVADRLKSSRHSGFVNIAVVVFRWRLLFSFRLPIT